MGGWVYIGQKKGRRGKTRVRKLATKTPPYQFLPIIRRKKPSRVTYIPAFSPFGGHFYCLNVVGTFVVRHAGFEAFDTFIVSFVPVVVPGHDWPFLSEVDRASWDAEYWEGEESEDGENVHGCLDVGVCAGNGKQRIDR